MTLGIILDGAGLDWSDLNCLAPTAYDPRGWCRPWRMNTSARRQAANRCQKRREYRLSVWSSMGAAADLIRKDNNLMPPAGKNR